MTDMLRLAGIAVCGAVMAMLLRRMRPEMGTVIALCAGVLLTLLILPALQSAMEGVASIAQTGGLSQAYLGQLLKICGISLLMDFAAQTCRDAGEGGLAVKVELAGRVVLFSLSLPFMEALLKQIMSLSP